MIRSLFFSAFLLLILRTVACSDGGTETARVAVVEVSGPALLRVGSSAQFSALVKDKHGSSLDGYTVTWSSSDPSVASVNGTGLVTALSEGEARIGATSEGIVGEAPLQVFWPQGSISGTVTVEGTALEGVMVILSGAGEGSVTTGAGGAFGFNRLEAGEYTVEISGFPEDVVFAAPVQEVTLGVDETLIRDFDGAYIRTSSIQGTIGTHEAPLEGVTVTITGAEGSSTSETAADGAYAVAGLRAGPYTIGIGGYPANVVFPETALEVTVGVGEAITVDFVGTIIGISSLAGVVSADGDGLPGVQVTLEGAGSGSVITGGAGGYEFTGLMEGVFTVTISGFPTDVIFASTSESVALGVGEERMVDFAGAYIRTSAISGSVSVEGAGLPGVQVTVVGPEGTRSTTTDGSGDYSIAGIRAGNYTVTLSGFPEDVWFSSTSEQVNVQVGEAVGLNFSGTYIRTSAVLGSVSVEGAGLPAVQVTVVGPEGTRSTTTDGAGNYSIAGLRAGTYTVTLSAFPEEVWFSSTSEQVTAQIGEAVGLNFAGVYIRTSTIFGSVSVEGAGLPGVAVAVVGPDGERNSVTNSAGDYSISGLRAGSYTVAISGFPEDVVFPMYASQVTLGIGEAVGLDFAGAYIRTSAISGSVTADGLPLEGVTVTLTGPDGNQDTATDAAGNYSFPGLRAGSYTVAISGFPEDVVFPMYASQVTLGIGEAVGLDFAGAYIRTSAISGSVTADGLPLEGVTVTLMGPDGNQDTATDAAGNYSFPGLRAGSYTVAISGFPANVSFPMTSAQVTLGVGEAVVLSFVGAYIGTRAERQAERGSAAAGGDRQGPPGQPRDPHPRQRHLEPGYGE